MSFQLLKLHAAPDLVDQVYQVRSVTRVTHPESVITTIKLNGLLGLVGVRVLWGPSLTVVRNAAMVTA